MIVATEDVPTGENLILSASFEKDGEEPHRSPTGILSLYHGDQKVGEGRIKTQPGAFAIAGEGLYRRPRRRRAGHRRLPRRGARTASPAARSTGSPSTSAASRTSTSSARPQPCSCASRRAVIGRDASASVARVWHDAVTRTGDRLTSSRRVTTEGGARTVVPPPRSGSRSSTTTARSGARSRCPSSSASSCSGSPRWPRPTRRCATASPGRRPYETRLRLARRGRSPSTTTATTAT